MRPPRAALLLALAFLLGCGGPRPGEAAPPPPRAPVAPPVRLPPAPVDDFAALSQGPSSRLVGVQRADARRAPGEARPALAFAEAVESLLDDPANRPAEEEQRALLNEALGYLDGALARTARGSFELQLSIRRAAIDARLGHAKDALMTLRRVLIDHPSLLGLDVLLRVAKAAGELVDVAAECRRVRPELRREVEVFALYDRCLAEVPGGKVEVLFPTAGREELGRYAKDRSERAARDALFHENIDEELHEHPPVGRDAGAPR